MSLVFLNMIVSKYFPLLLMPLLKTLIVKISNILGGIYFISLKKPPEPNLKHFKYEIWTSVKRSGN